MVELKKVLAEMSAHLASEHKFTPAASFALQVGPDAKRAAKDCLDTTFPAALFAEWLSRCPEAQEFLAARGVFWNVAGPPPGGRTGGPPPGSVRIGGDELVMGPAALRGRPGEQDVNVGVDDLPPGGFVMGPPDVVRVRIKGAWHPCLIVGLVGGMMKVQATDAAGPNYSMVTMDHVHPADAEAAERVSARLRSDLTASSQGQLRSQLESEGINLGELGTPE